MAVCGRSWATWLAAAVAAGSAVPSVAAPPLSSFAAQTFTGRQAAVAPSGPTWPAPPSTLATPAGVLPNGSPAAFARQPADTALGPASPMTDVPAGPVQRTAPQVSDAPYRQEIIRDDIRPAATGWVAVVGAVNRQGVYELPGGSIEVAELVERAGGPNGDATGVLRIVRNGRPLGPVHRRDDELIPGDVLIADSRGNGRFGMTIAGYQDQAGSLETRPNAAIAIVGLTDHPLAVNIPGEYATVTGVVQDIAGQKHLSPRDVTVVAGGGVEIPGDRAGDLTSGSVLVFDPRTVDARAVLNNPPKTYYYPAETPSPAPAAIPDAVAQTTQAVPTQPPTPTVETLGPAVVTPGTTDLSAAPPTAVTPSPEGAANLSLLPPQVEMLAPPPGEPQYQFPRTADASGAVPIGPPEADPHIVPVPTDNLFPAEPPATAAEPIDLSTTEEETADEGPSLGDLVPTILIGGLLGGITFACLRWLRGRQTIAAVMDRILGRTVRQIRSVVEEPPTVRILTPPRKELAPADLLAALIADRLAFREEPVEFPAALRVHGRSTALRKRRIDPPAAAIPEPHIPLAAPHPADKIESQAAERREERDEPQASFRFDPPQPIAAPVAGRATGTPFERALAALHEAGRRNGM